MNNLESYEVCCYWIGPALGAEEQLVAIDATQSFPQSENPPVDWLPQKLVWLKADFALEPTTLIGSDEMGPRINAISQLKSVGIDVEISTPKRTLRDY